VGQNKTLSVEKALDSYQAALAIDGDKHAFALLYKRWHPRFFKLALRLTRNPSDAQEVLQDAALTITKNIRRLEHPERFSAWAYTIIRRRAADYIKRVVHQRDIKDNAQHINLPPQRDWDTTISMKQALDRLSLDDRTLLLLFYIDGLSGAEMAAAMGLPLGTLKSRLFAARTKLKTAYNPMTTGETHE